MEETKPNKTAEFEESDFVGSLTDNDRQLENIQQQLNSAGVGWQIAIARAEPTFCAGHLETIPVVEPERPIDIDQIVARWGGQRLQLKIKGPDGKIRGGGTIHCRSFPPKVKGVVITEESMMRLGAPPTPATTMPQINQQPAAPQAQNPNPLGIDIPGLMKMAMAGKGGGDTALAGKLLEYAFTMQQNAMKQAQSAPQMNMMKQMEGMLGMFEMFGKFKTMFGGEVGGGDSEDSMIPMLMQLAQGMMGGGNGAGSPSPPRQRRRPTTISPPTGYPTAPRPPARPQAPRPRERPQAPPVPANQLPLQSVNTNPPVPVKSDDDVNLDSLAQKLCSLSAEEAAEVALNAFGNMPAEKRSVAMQNFLGEFMEDDVDDSSTNVHDDLYEDEPELPPVPGQNGFSQGEGGGL